MIYAVWFFYHIISVYDKFMSSSYQTIGEFVADIRQMLINCFKFNGPDHPISRKALRLECLFDQKINLLSR